MARAFSARSKLYAEGVYGPYAVDGFTKDDTTALQWTMTVEGWPTDKTVRVAVVSMQWDNGAFSTSTIYGGPTDMRGVPLTQVSGILYVPMEADTDGNPTKSATTAGAIQIEVFVPIQTAVSLTALA